MSEHELSDTEVILMMTKALEQLPTGCPVALVPNSDGVAEVPLRVRNRTVRPPRKIAFIQCENPIKGHSVCRHCDLKTGVTTQVLQQPMVN